MGNLIGGEAAEKPQDFEPVRDDTIFGQIEFSKVDVPHDADGFCMSFTADQEEEYLKFFDTYGFAVIRDILSQDECNEHIDTFWTQLESQNWSFFGQESTLVNRNDSTTWDDKFFPANRLGIFGSDISQDKCSWKNRQNEKMYKVFSAIYGKKNLWVSLDRMGIMRPTVGVPVGKLAPTKYRTDANPAENPELPVQDFPNWKTQKLWLHWDLNPWAWTGTKEGVEYSFNGFIQENNGSKNTGDKKLQGILHLTESRVGDGGFCCVPGFHKNLKEWAEKTAESACAFKCKKHYSFVNVHPDDKMNSQVQKISCRPGSLIVWSSELPHCNYPNDSYRFRINQYVKMFPAMEGCEGTDARKKTLDALTKNVDVTELGKKLFGIKGWSEEVDDKEEKKE